MTHPTPPSPIGVGIVGLSAHGGWASIGHVTALAELDGYELRALSASSARSAEEAGEKHGVPLVFDNAEELARRDEVDLVVVAVKVPRHHELIVPALEAGKMVLAEWPLAANLAQAEELSALAAAKGVPTLVGLQGRSAPHLRYLRDLVADGYVGRVLSTTVIGSGLSWGATYDREPYLLDRDNGATLLSVPFGHTVDAVAMVLGEPVEVSATTAIQHPVVTHRTTGETAPMTSEDQLAVTARLESGTLATFHIRGGLSRATDFHWEINGTEGDLVITSDTPAVWMGRVTVRGARGEETTLSELPTPAEYESRLPAFAGRRAEPAYGVAHAYARFEDDLRNGTRETPDFTHALRRHRLLHRIRQSAEQGTRLPVTP